jgi:hypothetical protein
VESVTRGSQFGIVIRNVRRRIIIIILILDLAEVSCRGHSSKKNQ